MLRDKIEKELRERLWVKATKEVEKFKNDILSKNKEDIYSEAYVISMLNEFYMMCNTEESLLSVNEVKALLKEDYPVHTLYNYYMKTEGGLSDLYETIEYSLNGLVKENQHREQVNNKER